MSRGGWTHPQQWPPTCQHVTLSPPSCQNNNLKINLIKIELSEKIESFISSLMFVISNMFEMFDYSNILGPC